MDTSFIAHRLMRSLVPARWRDSGAALLLLSALAAPAGAAGTTVDLADKPLFSSVSVPGNLILALSVEWPTATTPAYASTTDYAASSTFLGYFDPEKCYQYVYNATTPTTSYFNPTSKAKSHACSGSSGEWSGNYLNWASMQTLDAFRWVLTGGNRSVDTSSETILTKTFASTQGRATRNPDKSLASNLSGAVPMTDWSSVTTSVKGQGISMLLTGAGVKAKSDNVPSAGCLKTKLCVDASQPIVDYGSSAASKLAASAVYRVYINVKVCSDKVGLEENCKAYGTNFKPEGLMQRYATNLRYSTFAYLNDSDIRRDGGVMRARMNFIGPTQPVPGSAEIANPATEWSSSTGIMLANPHKSDASATVAELGLSEADIAYSGAMNYLNKFGYATGVYKSADPVSELYYAALRYFKRLGNVAAYSDMSGASRDQKVAYADGFPVITKWDDPIAYSCQRNFILGIGDVNTHDDANLFGSTIRSADEPTMPGGVAGDKSVDVNAATNMVGQLEGYSGLGAVSPIPGFGNSNFIAGLAYDAHTMDIRSDLTGPQTVNTYWMDVMEGQVYGHKNQYWLAAKYGGFKVPKGFSPYDGGNGPRTIEDSAWYNSGDTLTPDSASAALKYSTDNGATDKRPDNYFPGNQPDAMKEGLTEAFAKISSETEAATSAVLATVSPNVASSGSISYSASYDPRSWTGDVVASTVEFDAEGAPTFTPKWDARDALDASSVTASTRTIVTCCNSAGAALPFTATELAAASLDSRTNYTSFAAVPGVKADSQSASDFVAYLRGDRTKEAGRGGVYRARTSRLGDIVNSKPVAVGVPSFPYYDASNPGYSSFRSSHASRKTVVYAGANDGMLHAFDGSVGAAVSGNELFAYIPSFVYGNSSTASTTGLASLGNPNYAHHYFVDATPGQFDADLNHTGGSTSTAPDWRTLLIGGLGKGGKGYYAIDVTDPAGWTSEAAVARNVMWEFTHPHMGYSYGQPSVVKTKKYGWVVVLTSGYNNDDGVGYFFFVNPRTGKLLEAVATPTGSTLAPVNLAHETAFIPDYTDMTADAVYAGDLQGNLWRLDVTGTGSYGAPTLIAELTNAKGDAQPVTTRPLVEFEPNSSARHVMVGTGELMADSDIVNSSQQSFYSIVDGTSAPGGFYTNATLPGGVSFPITRGALNPNPNLLTGIGSSPGSAMGWYFDLPVIGGIAQRVDVNATANQGVVAFIGNLPSGDVCDPSGIGTLYATSFATGKTVLVGSTGLIASYTPKPTGKLTDVAILNVGGVLRMYTGGAKNVPVNAPANLSTPTGIQQLNWREVPLAD